MSKFKLGALCSLMMISTALFAQTSTTAPATTKVPSSQGLASVDKNLAKDADSKGLRNAADRIERNEDRKEAKKHKPAHLSHADQSAVDKKDSTAKPVRAETAERAEKIERPAKPERPEKISRPTR